MSCGLTSSASVELVRRAGELAEHQDAAVGDAARDELLRDEVHPVVQRRHEHHVGSAVQRRNLHRLERLVDVVDGRCSQRGRSRR